MFKTLNPYCGNSGGGNMKELKFIKTPGISTEVGMIHIGGNTNDVYLWNVNFDKDLKIIFDEEKKEFTLKVKPSELNFRVVFNDKVIS